MSPFHRLVLAVSVSLWIMLSLACSKPGSGKHDGAPGGSGGQASGGSGPGGGGGAGGSGGAGGVDDPSAWLIGDEGWIVADAPSAMVPYLCEFRIAARESLERFPIPVWEQCGPGCERMDPSLAGQRAWNAVLGSTDDGKALLGLWHSAGPESAEERSVLHRVIDLASGRTLVAIRAGPHGMPYVACGLYSSAQDPTVIQLTASPDFYTTSVMYGNALVETGGYSFRLPALAGRGRLIHCEEVVLETPDAPMFFSCIDGVLAMPEVGLSNVVTISTRSGSVGRPIGHSRESVFFERRGQDRFSEVLQWSRAAGERPASTGIDGEVMAMGIGDRYLAGALGRLRVPGSSYYEDLRFATRETESATLEWEIGPKIVEAAALVDRIATRGEYLAASALFGRDGPQAVFLTRKSDWKIRRVVAHEGRSFALATLALDSRYLYVVEVDGIVSSRKVGEIFRYDLKQFELLGEDG